MSGQWEHPSELDRNETISISFGNTTVSLLQSTQAESCKTSTYIVEVSGILLQQEPMQDLDSAPFATNDFGDYESPEPIEYSSIGQDSAPGVAVFVIPSVFVVLALLFVVAMNNRTLTILARDRSGSTPPVDTEASAASPKPPEPPMPRVKPPKV